MYIGVQQSRRLEADAEQQFVTWASRQSRGLQRTAFLLCGDWHVAEDLVQDTLTRTAMHWKRLAAKGDPDAYARIVLVNAARGRWRRRSTQLEQPVASFHNETQVGDGADDRADRHLLLTGLAELPERQRAAVVLRYLEQLSEAETAVAMGCSIGTVKSQTHRALKTLNRFLTIEADSC